MGGEPLLHPDVALLAGRVRFAFPRSRISLVTNGILLSRQRAKFWEECQANNILIQVTRYPIGLDLQKSENTARHFGVTLEVTDTVSVFHRFLNIENNSDPWRSFRQCRSRFKCPFLRDGRIFLCPLPANIHIFNKRFHTSVPTTSDDSICIFGNVHSSDILEFLNRPSPFCCWCLEDWPVFDWGITTKTMNDWTGTVCSTGCVNSSS